MSEPALLVCKDDLAPLDDFGGLTQHIMVKVRFDDKPIVGIVDYLKGDITDLDVSELEGFIEEWKEKAKVLEMPIEVTEDLTNFLETRKWFDGPEETDE